MPRKKVEHPNEMTVVMVNGTIRSEPFPERRTGAVVRGGERIAGAMGLAKDTLYRRKDKNNIVWVNSISYSLGKDPRGGLITWTNSTDNWKNPNGTIRQELEAERDQKIREGAKQQAAVAPRKQGKFTKGG